MENSAEKGYEYVSLGGYRSGDSDHDFLHQQEENKGGKKETPTSTPNSSSRVLTYQIAVTIALILTWLINVSNKCVSGEN